MDNKMYLWKFEQWKNGSHIKNIAVNATTMEEAVSRISSNHEGVFRLYRKVKLYSFNNIKNRRGY